MKSAEPVSPHSDQRSVADAELQSLAAQGKVRPGVGEIGADFWKLPRPRVRGKTLKEIMDEEQEK
jgi:hypothetical protein